MNIIAKIDKQIVELKKRKAAIQRKCSHPSTIETPWGNDGNILTGRDPSYGVDYECELCGAKWTKAKP